MAKNFFFGPGTQEAAAPLLLSDIFTRHILAAKNVAAISKPRKSFCKEQKIYL
jgi:hypothetical protein